MRKKKSGAKSKVLTTLLCEDKEAAGLLLRRRRLPSEAAKSSTFSRCCFPIAAIYMAIEKRERRCMRRQRRGASVEVQCAMEEDEETVAALGSNYSPEAGPGLSIFSRKIARPG
jgi:hypothetical protein